jgi:RNA polymerase sigma factor (sigma-70 family)
MLWPLLCAITINKVRQQIRFQSRQRRDPRREERRQDASDQQHAPENLLAGGEPSPRDAVMFAEQMENVLATLSNEECTVVEMKLQGCNHQEIADKLLCSQRTVRRVISRIRGSLRDSLVESRDA